jgi:hypothetical protein
MAIDAKKDIEVVLKPLDRKIKTKRQATIYRV